MKVRNRLRDESLRWLNRAHRALLAISGGRIGWSLGSVLVVELHTIGRSTGKRRSIMLNSPIHRDGRYYLVASKGGDDRHPQWYRNLVAHPEAELTDRGKTTRIRARTATRQEKAELWPEIVAANRGYERYQRKTSRDIPIVICEPIGPAEDARG